MKRKAVEGPSSTPQKKKKKGNHAETIPVYDSENVYVSAEPSQTLGDLGVDIDLNLPSEPLTNNPCKNQFSTDLSDSDSDEHSDIQSELSHSEPPEPSVFQPILAERFSRPPPRPLSPRPTGWYDAGSWRIPGINEPLATIKPPFNLPTENIFAIN